MRILFEEKLVFEYSHSEISDWRAAMQGAIPSTAEEVRDALSRATELIENKALGEALAILTPLHEQPLRPELKALVKLPIARIMMETNMPVYAMGLANAAKKFLRDEQLQAAIAIEAEARAQHQAQAA